MSVSSIGSTHEWGLNRRADSSRALIGKATKPASALNAAVAALDAEVAASSSPATTRGGGGGGGGGDGSGVTGGGGGGGRDTEVGISIRSQLMPDGSVVVIKKGEFRLWNGDRFVGETFNDRREGHGVLYLANGDVYMGDFHAGAYGGFGVLKEASLVVKGVEWRGRRYQGEWVAGLRHGKGMQRASNGDVYEGGYAHDRACGHGVMRYASGVMYNGAWKDDRWDGEGKLFESSDTSYVGAFRLGVRHGHGKQRYHAGGTYTGAWRMGQRHGIGRRVWASGAEYEGEWVDDVMCGRGIYRSAAGSTYIGSFADDRFHGEGTYVGVDGTRYQGWFHAGAYVRTGWVRRPDGGSYRGEYNALLRCGVTLEVTSKKPKVGMATMFAASAPGTGVSSSGGAGGGGGGAAAAAAVMAARSGSDDAEEEEEGSAGGGLMAVFGAEREDADARAAAKRFKTKTRPGHVIAGSDEDLAWLALGGERVKARTAPAADSRRHGRGVQTWAGGTRYEGDWYQDEQHGHGVYTTPNGSTYDGDWEHGGGQGRGRATYTNDGLPFTCPLGSRHDGAGECVYEGSWERDEFDGHGTFTCADGHSYTGYWRAGKKHGNGVLILIPPSVTGIGADRVDSAGRKWSATYTAMREYRGAFDDGDRHGEGAALLVNGDELMGTFVRNKLEGLVRWRMPSLEREVYAVFKAGNRVAWVAGRDKVLMQMRAERPDLWDARPHLAPPPACDGYRQHRSRGCCRCCRRPCPGGWQPRGAAREGARGGTDGSQHECHHSVHAAPRVPPPRLRQAAAACRTARRRRRRWRQVAALARRAPRLPLQAARVVG